MRLIIARIAREKKPAAPRARPAFSLVELLFAILVLGVGTVAIACMLTASVSQSQLTVDESASAAVARQAFATLCNVMTMTNAPPTNGVVQSIDSVSTIWNELKGNVIVPSDPQFGWVALYRRDDARPLATVYIITTRERNRSIYTKATDVSENVNDTTGQPATLGVKHIDVSVDLDSTTGEGVLQFDTENPVCTAVAEGAFVILGGPGVGGETTGRVYRVGTPRDASKGLWNCWPGFAPKSADDIIGAPTNGLLIGRGYVDPQNPTRGYQGPAQDLGLFVSFVHLK